MSDPRLEQPDSSRKAGEIGVHPIVIQITIGAVLCFLAVTWIDFGGGRETDFLLVIVVLFFAFFFGLFLLTASYTLGDERWPVQDTSLQRFLTSDVRIGSETMRGRAVLIEIALLPVTLALAATLIGLAWVIFG